MKQNAVIYINKGVENATKPMCDMWFRGFLRLEKIYNKQKKKTKKKKYQLHLCIQMQQRDNLPST